MGMVINTRYTDIDTISILMIYLVYQVDGILPGG